MIPILYQVFTVTQYITNTTVNIIEVSSSLWLLALFLLLAIFAFYLIIRPIPILNLIVGIAMMVLMMMFISFLGNGILLLIIEIALLFLRVIR